MMWRRMRRIELCVGVMMLMCEGDDEVRSSFENRLPRHHWQEMILACHHDSVVTEIYL
jgi:hypothetical protein